MAQWQVLRAREASWAALGRGRPGGGRIIGGYHVNHGPHVSAHYSTATVPANGRSFSVSPGGSEQLAMQELNRRLASYMDKVRYLEAANEKLEQQIQEVLDRKCPGDLREMDRHLETVYLLQVQISECETAQAQVKLQLLSAELDVFNLSGRCDQEREHCGILQADLRDLRLVEERLKVCSLPELHSLVSSHTLELQQLQDQHQEDIGGLLAQVSGGVAVEMQCTESWDMNQQLEDLREKSMVLVTKNQTQNKHWFNSQVSVLSSPEASRPSGSEVVQAKLNELRRTIQSLEGELAQLQALNVLLENTELELGERFSLQLAGLQQRATSLGMELESVLQATARQAADYQALLDIKTNLHKEMQEYRRLLDAQSGGVSSSSSNFMACVTSHSASTNSHAVQSKAMLDNTAHAERANLGLRTVQTVTRDHISPECKTTVVNTSDMLSQTEKTVRSNLVNTAPDIHSKQPQSSSLTLINTRSLTGLSESQRQGEATGNTIGASTGALLDSKQRESITVSTMMIVGPQISQAVDEDAVIQASKPEINIATGMTRIAPDTQTNKTAGSAVQAAKSEINIVTEITSIDPIMQAIKKTGTQDTKPGMNTATEITKTDEDAVIQASKPEINIATGMTRIVPGTQTTKEDNVKASEAEINFVTEMTSIDPSQTASEVEKEGGLVREAGISYEIDCTEVILEEVEYLLIKGPKVTKTDTIKANSVDKIETGEQTGADIRADDDTKRQVQWIVANGSQAGTVAGMEVSTVEVTEVDSEAKVINVSLIAGTVHIEESVKEEAVHHVPNIEQTISTTHTSTKYTDKGLEDSNAMSHIPITEQCLLTANMSSTEHIKEAVKDAGTMSHSVSTSYVHKSEQSLSAQGETSSTVILTDGQDGEHLKEVGKEEQGKKGEEEREETKTRQEEGASPIPKLEQRLTLCHASNSNHSEEGIKEADTVSYIKTIASYSPNDNKNLFTESEVKSAVIMRHFEREGMKVGEVRQDEVGSKVEEGEKQEKIDKGEKMGEERDEGEETISDGNQVFRETENLNSYPFTEHGCQVIDNVKVVTIELDSEMDNTVSVEIVKPADQGTPLSPLEADRCTSLTDSGVVSSSTDTEEHHLSPTDPGICLSSIKAEVLLSPMNQEVCPDDPEECVRPRNPDSFLSPNDPEMCLSPDDQETCFSPVEAELFFNPMTQEIYPDDPEECVSPRHPDSFLSPNDQEMCFSPDDQETCFSPVEAEGCLSPDEPDECMSPNDEEACMSPTEEDAFVKPIERYILSTKEDSQCVSFGGDQKWSREHRAANVTSPMRDWNSLSSGSMGSHVISGVSLSCKDIGSRQTSPGSSVKVSSSLGSGFIRSSVGAQEKVVSPGGPYCRTSIGDKVLCFGGLNRRSVGDREAVMSPGGRYKDSSIGDSEGVSSPVGSHGDRYSKRSLGDREEPAINRMGSGVWQLSATNRGTELNNSRWMVASAAANSGLVLSKSASFGSVGATGGTSFSGMASNAGGKISGMDHNRRSSLGGVAANSDGMASNIATSFGGVATNSAAMITGMGGNVAAATTAGGQVRIRHDSGEWIVYGGSTGHMGSLAGSGRLTSAGSGDMVSGPVATSPARGGRFSGGSGEWKVYGGSNDSGGRLSSSAGSRLSGPPSGQRSSSTASGGRFGSASSGGTSIGGGRRSTSVGSGDRLSSSCGGGRRSTSVGSGGRLSSSGSGGRLSGSAASPRVSSSRRIGSAGSAGSGEWKPVYRVASGRMSSVGSGGRLSGTTGGHRAPSPGAGRRLSSKGSSDRLSSHAGGRISGSSGPLRTNSTGGRVISSSDRPIRNTGSGVGANKERISVCKMAALSISAAGKERSEERQRQAKRSQQQQAAATSPRVQRWLTTGGGVTGNGLDGLDDIIRL